MTNGDSNRQEDLAIRRPSSQVVDYGRNYVDPTVEARCFNEIMRLRIEMMERENNLKEALRAEFRAAIQQSNTELRAAMEQNRNNLQTRIDENNTALENRLHQNNTDLRAAVQQGSSNYTAVASLVVTVIAFMAGATLISFLPILCCVTTIFGLLDPMEQQATIRWRGSQGGHYVDPTVEARCLYEIMRLRIEMMEKVNNLKETLRAELRAEIQLSNNELRAVIQQNKTDLQARILQSNNELRAQIRQSNTELREVTQHNKTDLQTPILQNKTDFQTQILRNNTEIRASRIMHRAPQIVTGPSNFTTNAALVIMVIAFIWNVFFACFLTTYIK